MRPFHTCSIKSGHTEHCSLIRFANIIFTYNQLNAVPFIRLVEPLISIHCHLRSERLCENKHIANNRIIRPKRKQSTA